MRMSFVMLFVFWGMALLFGFWQGGVTAWFITCSLSIILVYLLLVYIATLRSLDITVSLERDHYITEEDALVTFKLNHNSLIPLVWLIVEQSWINQTSDNNWTFRKVIFPGLQRSITGKYRIKCMQRGLYYSNRIEVFTGDVFGIITKKKKISLSEHFVVYPKPLNIRPEFIDLLHGSDGSSSASLQEVSAFSGIRDYTTGDAMNRIHWKSTARTNELKTKELEASMNKRVRVLLDAGAASYSAEKQISLFEKSVQVTASLLKYAKENQITSDLICSNKEHKILPSSSSLSLHQAYTLLSGIIANGEKSLHEVLQHQGDRITSDTVLLCITPMIDDRLLSSIRQLRSKNIHVGILLVYSSLSLSWHQIHLKQQFQSMGCIFYSVQHTKIHNQHIGGVEYVS